MVLPFLYVIPNQLIFQPGSLFLGNFHVLTGGVMMNGKPLAALFAHNGPHQDVVGTLRAGSDARDNPIQIHQRGSRRGRRLRSPPRPPSRNPPLRGACGFASFTVSARPPDSLPFNSAIAFSAS